MALIREILNEAADRTWYAYGKFYGRYDEETIKVKIPESVLIKACQLAAAEKDEELEDLLESLNSFNKENAIGAMWEDHSPKACINMIKNGKPFNASVEEFAFGYAPNQNKAKDEYLKIADEDEDDWED